jgi:hypothetical protein
MSYGKYYEEECFCEHCQKDTMHLVFETGHERDSSGDWRECLECKWTCSGLTDRYNPPIEE